MVIAPREFSLTVSMVKNIRVGNFGDHLYVKAVSNGVEIKLSEATRVVGILRKPSGAILTLTPEIVDMGVHNDEALFVTTDGQIDETGRWTLELMIEIDGARYSCDPVDFQVLPSRADG